MIVWKTHKLTSSQVLDVIFHPPSSVLHRKSPLRAGARRSTMHEWTRLHKELHLYCGAQLKCAGAFIIIILYIGIGSVLCGGFNGNGSVLRKSFDVIF